MRYRNRGMFRFTAGKTANAGIPIRFETGIHAFWFHAWEPIFVLGFLVITFKECDGNGFLPLFDIRHISIELCS